MLTNDQERVIKIFDLPEEGWNFDDKGNALIIIELEDYSDRWTVSDDGALSMQERSTDGENWVLMCPDCGYPANSEEHLNGA